MPQKDRGPIDGASISSVDGNLEKLLKGLFRKVSELIDDYATQMEQWSLINTRFIVRDVISEVCVLLLHFN